MTERLCRNCRLYDLEDVKDITGRIFNARAAQCLWSPPQFEWPESIDRSYRHVRRPVKMKPTLGASCVAFEARDD